MQCIDCNGIEGTNLFLSGISFACTAAAVVDVAVVVAVVVVVAVAAVVVW